jgi:hypothetical protein
MIWLLLACDPMEMHPGWTEHPGHTYNLGRFKVERYTRNSATIGENGGSTFSILSVDGVPLDPSEGYIDEVYLGDRPESETVALHLVHRQRPGTYVLQLQGTRQTWTRLCEKVSDSGEWRRQFYMSGECDVMYDRTTGKVYPMRFPAEHRGATPDWFEWTLSQESLQMETTDKPPWEVSETSK